MVLNIFSLRITVGTVSTFYKVMLAPEKQAVKNNLLSGRLIVYQKIWKYLN